MSAPFVIISKVSNRITRRSRQTSACPFGLDVICERLFLTGKPKILVAGILDTKGNEIRFLADRVEVMGGEPRILELSVGKEVGWADLCVSDVLRKVGRTSDEIVTLDRAKASDIIVEGAIELVVELLSQGGLDGMMAYGGSLCTSMATRIMQKLPIGVPKLMLSTMTSGDIGCYVGTRDIAMLYPICEVGLNTVTRKILNYAAAGIVGMSSAIQFPETEQKPLIGCTMLGVTTPGVMQAAKFFEKKDYEVMINHAVGSGGRSMEELVTEGFVIGLLDLTTHEITDHLLGGVLDAGPDRLTAAALRGTPQVLSTGGLELIDFGPRNTVPKKLEEEEALEVRGRVIHIHNPTVTVVGTTTDEAYLIGRHIAEKLNLAIGPTALCVPLRGSGAYEISEPNLSLGWAGPGPGPLWLPDPDRADWSLRCRYFLSGLAGRIDANKSNLDVLLCDSHINEPRFANFVAELLDQMLSGRWKGGMMESRLSLFPSRACLTDLENRTGG